MNNILVLSNTKSSLKSKRDGRTKDKETAVQGTSQHKGQKKQDSVITCFFCREAGHEKHECSKYATWHVKKGTLLNLVYSEVNLDLVPDDTWWIDTGATTHISVTRQDCIRSRMPIDGERYIYVGNDNKVTVEAIGVFRIQLETRFYLD